MELTCIVCPRGCNIKYDLENGKAINIVGNSCPRGKAFCETEISCPTRMITSSVLIENAIYKKLPVITSSPIAKDKIFAVMDSIHKVKVSAPININDIIIKNVCDTGVDIIASRTMNKI